MARRRYVSTDVSIDKRLNKLAVEHGDFAALLYTWMVPHANDDATLNGDIDEFMATVLPMRRDKTPADVDAALRAMCHAGLITWDGVTIYFPVEAFYRYQTYIAADKRRTADAAMGERPSAVDADEQRETPKNAEECRGTAENAVSLSPSLSPSVSVSPSLRPRRSAAVAPEGETPLPPPGKTVETVEWKEEMCRVYGSRLEDFEETWKFILGSPYLKRRDDRRGYIEGQLANACKRWAERANGNGNHRRSDPQDDPRLQELRRLGVIIE